jgi:hypothetical protein
VGSWYHFTEIPSPSEGYTWDDIAYVIGGYNWKAHFIIEAKRTLCLPAIELARWLPNYMDKTLVCKDADWMTQCSRSAEELFSNWPV